MLERFNHNGKYDHIIARYLISLGEIDESKKKLLKHCVTEQIFVYNDFAMLADLFWKENDVLTTIDFLKAQIECYKIFMKDEGGYADRAYAGKSHIISKLYKQINDEENYALWKSISEQYAEKYRKNPSMKISSLKYCENVVGRMIDNYGSIINKNPFQEEAENL